MVFSLLIRSLNNIFSKQRHRNMELKRLEVYQKEYRESSSATIEKADAKYKEIYSAECTRSVESGRAIEFLKKSPVALPASPSR